MRPRARYLLIFAAAFIACQFAFLSGRNLYPAFPDLAITSEGTFPSNGENPGDPLPFGAKIRRWGSYVGSDQNTGSLRLGPFSAGHRLRVGVTGFPETAGISLFLERTDTHERLPIAVHNAFSTWVIIETILPETWQGAPITVNAIDASTAFTGWLGVTEPLRGGIGEKRTNLYESLASWSLNGLLLGLLWLAAWRILARSRWTPAVWTPLVAAGGVAAVGFLVFWAYFASVTLGHITGGSVFVLAVAVLWRTRREQFLPDQIREAKQIVFLTVSIGLFYLAVLHLFPSPLGFYDLAANRFREDLPGDNSLSHWPAAQLLAGTKMNLSGTDWHVSDRPPLQSGWQLLTLPVTTLLRQDPLRSTATAAVWLQSLWIPAGYAFLVTLGVRRRRAAAWIVILSLTGFFIQNTLFTWPKMSAGAFVCGTFAFWVLPEGGTRRRRDYVLGGALAGLAWMSHGAVAFSLCGLVPWIIWRLARGEWRGWMLAGAVFLLFALPWLAFQKLSDPPGDRLLKWHLGGHVPPDPRGAWTVIKEGYTSQPPLQILLYKAKNFHQLVSGTWTDLFQFTPAHGELRRDDEFYFVFRAMTWWLLAPLALGIALLTRRRRHLTSGWKPSALVATWILTTLITWCLLLFGPSATIIHQGSFATMIALFVTTTAWFELAASGWILAIGALQLGTFVTTWAWPNSHLPGSPTGWLFLAATAIPLLGIFLAGLRSDTQTADARSGRSGSPSSVQPCA